ncbi:DUF6427 family protein [Flavicella sp.]|uniref:DUF6427 family protein n=1 Tax=Flavicella sp. TaxID=2957742 RepID=UPI003019CAB8
MLANFFDKTKPINNIVLIFIFIVIYFTHFVLQQTITNADVLWLKTSVYFFFNLLFLIFCSYFFIKNGISNENLHNTFIIILLYCIFPSTFESENLLFVALFFLFIYNNLAQLKGKGNKQLTLFDSGIYTGISFLLFDWSILFLAFIYTGVFLAQKVSFKNLISPIIGFIAPVFLFFTYCFLTDNTSLFVEKFAFNYSMNFHSYLTAPIQISLIFISIALTVSIVFVVPKVLSISNPYRYQYVLAIAMLFTSSLAILLDTTKNGNEFLLLFVPASIFMGRFLKTITSRILKEVFLISFAVFSLFILIKYP